MSQSCPDGSPVKAIPEADGIRHGAAPFRPEAGPPSRRASPRAGACRVRTLRASGARGSVGADLRRQGCRSVSYPAIPAATGPEVDARAARYAIVPDGSGAMKIDALVENLYYPAVLASALGLGLVLIDAGLPSSLILTTTGLAFAVLCFAMERRFGEAEQWRLDGVEARTDILHALVSNTIPTAVFRALFLSAIVGVSGWVTAALGFGLWPRGWPLLGQFAFALVAVELVSYGIHRVLHRSRLWPLHAVHHCSPRMYFLLSVRKHPLQAFVTYGGRLSFLWLLGIPEPALTLLLVYTGANSYVQHSNIRMNTRAFSYVFATPELHRLHHSKRESELNANFGDVLILWDLLFGTRIAPRDGDVIHDAIGLPGIEVPQTYWSHLRLPFEWQRLHRDAAASR